LPGRVALTLARPPQPLVLRVNRDRAPRLRCRALRAQRTTFTMRREVGVTPAVLAPPKGNQRTLGTAYGARTRVDLESILAEHALARRDGRLHLHVRDDPVVFEVLQDLRRAVRRIAIRRDRLGLRA